MELTKKILFFGMISLIFSNCMRSMDEHAIKRKKIEKDIENYIGTMEFMKEYSSPEEHKKKLESFNEKINILKQSYKNAGGTWSTAWNTRLKDLENEIEEYKELEQSCIIKIPKEIQLIENLLGKSLNAHYMQFVIADFEPYGEKVDGTRFLKKSSPLVGYKALYESIKRVKRGSEGGFKQFSSKDPDRGLYFGEEIAKNKLEKSLNVFLPTSLGIWRQEIVDKRDENENKYHPQGADLSASELEYLINKEKEKDPSESLLGKEYGNLPITVIHDGKNISEDMKNKLAQFKEEFQKNKECKHVFIIGQNIKEGRPSSWYSLVVLCDDYIVSGERNNIEPYKDAVNNILNALGLDTREEEKEEIEE